MRQRGFKKTSRAGLFLARYTTFVSGALTIASLSFLPSHAKSDSAQAVADVLREMGMEDVKVDDCTIEYSRHVTPTDENNGYYYFTDTINLNSFANFQESKIRNIRIRGRTLYEFRIAMKDWYVEEFRKVQDFAIEVDRRLNGQIWPFEHPFYQVRPVPWLQEEVQESGLLELGLSTRKDHSNFGQVTVFYPGMHFNFDDEASLRNLKESIMIYAKTHRCDIE